MNAKNAKRSPASYLLIENAPDKLYIKVSSTGISKWYYIKTTTTMTSKK